MVCRTVENQELAVFEEFRDLARVLAKETIWVKIVGFYLIVNGAATALSIVGLVIAWLPIWLGVLLLQFANGMETFAEHGDPDDMLRAFNRLALIFKIIGITVTVSIVLLVLIGLVLVAVLAAV